MRDIYFDSAATTKPCEAAINAALRAIEEYGNPSSSHYRGIAAKKILDTARERVSDALGCDTSELFFTGSGTESNNLAIIGAAGAKKRFSKTVISTDSEHPSVEQSLRHLEEDGYKVIRLSTRSGEINADELKSALAEKVALVSIMQANNETGALYDIEAIRRAITLSGCGALLHCDATQSFLKIKNRMQNRVCDLISLSAHKINGLKGCGALFVKKGINLPAFMLGGGQERGLRSGTENIPAIAAFGAACAEWKANGNRIGYITELRDYTEKMLVEELGDRVAIHRPAERICGILSISLLGVKSEVALNFLSGEGICISAGSACSSHKKESRVLGAFGLSGEEIESSLRISYSYLNNKEEVKLLVESLKKAAALTERI